ncbi:MAG: Ldh family oxidoreductase [Acidimicrobiia bacterium]|nr:Ldh family oxidoreductase [Acidimicrobiia bacterium]
MSTPSNERLPRGIPDDRADGPPQPPVELGIDAARTFAAAAFSAAGMAPDDAELMATNMLWADQRGVDTHGVQRVSWYVKWFTDGISSPTAQTEIVKEGPSFLVGDGHSGLGQLVATRFADQVIAKAKSEGLCLGLIRNSNDWGCGAWYPCRAADEGLVGIATTTSVPNLAPWGSRTRLFGNNPIAFAFPRRPPERHVVYDAALTPVALGKVLRARAEGKEVPAEWGFRDRDGNPTTDPAVAMGGIIPAIGGYKGTGLALVTNVLAGVLSGSFHTANVDVGKRGQFFLFIDPGAVGDREHYLDAMEDMVAQMRAAGEGDNVLPGEQVFLPGEPEWRNWDTRTAAGRIAYPASVVRSLDKVAEQLGIDPVVR